MNDLELLAAWAKEANSYRGGGWYTRWGKRSLDILLAAPAAVISLPIVVLAAILIRLDSEGSSLFYQMRVGRNASTFRLCKLRTMSVNNLQVGQVSAGNPHVTRIGRLLRRTKIDELPQLWNVLRGDMSLVGPRPCLVETALTVDQNGRRRFLVRPGITGLAQTRGNIALSWPERWVLDRRYVEHVSLTCDLRILIKTLAVVPVGEDKWIHR